MTINHSISDLVTIIRNGYLSRKKTVFSPVSKVREAVLKTLKEEGYISSYSILRNESCNKLSKEKFNINLKYHLSNPVISEIKVISKPGKRVYCSAKEIPVVKNGLGTVIISTSKGIISDHYARQLKFGGEVLLEVF